jgi:hypothetical protein
MNYNFFIYFFSLINFFQKCDTQINKNVSSIQNTFFFLKGSFKYQIHEIRINKEFMKNVLENINAISIGIKPSIYFQIKLPFFVRNQNKVPMHIENDSKNKFNNSIYSYNERIYLKLKLKIINEYIRNIEEHLFELENLQSFHTDIIHKIHRLKIYKEDFLKNRKNILLEINKITSFLQLIYGIKEVFLKDENFFVPFLGFDRKKIIKYIFNSYYYKYNRFIFQENIYNDLIYIPNVELTFNKDSFGKDKNGNLSSSISYEKKYFIENIQTTNKNIMLYEIIENYYFIKNLTYENFLLKEHEKLLNKYIKEIEKYIDIINKNKDINEIMNIYKKKKEILDLRLQILDIFYKKVKNTWDIFLKLIPLEFCKKFYKVNIKKLF